MQEHAKNNAAPRPGVTTKTAVSDHCPTGYCGKSSELPEQDAGASPLSGIRKVELPFCGCHIFQDVHAQAVSHAAAGLQAAALEVGGNAPLRVLELGSGCGIVSIMLALQRPNWHIEGVEIQPSLHQLAQSNALLCKVETYFILGDLREFQGDPAYDLILSNPPWQKRGSGVESKHRSRNISRFEILCQLPALLQCIQRNLNPHGEALLLYPLEREQELLQESEKSLLDIFTAPAVAGLKEQRIYRIRHKGMPR